MTATVPRRVEGVLAWDPASGELEALPAAAAREPDAPAAIDSFLLADGWVRGFEHHWRRFADACADSGLGEEDTARFRDAVLRTLPRAGWWFPRVELAGGDPPRLALRIRSAPRRGGDLVAWVMPEPLARRAPQRKGPDLGRLQEARARAGRHGAEEAILVDARGGLLEGAVTSLLWWEGESLWAVPLAAPVLPGVTRRLLLDAAASCGVEVRTRVPRPAELEGAEVWLVNALHGVRGVRGLVGPAGEVRLATPVRVGVWQRRLESLARRLPPAGC